MSNSTETNPEEDPIFKSYEERCAERAGKTFYWNMDGLPIKETYSEDGKISRLYALQDDKWVQNFHGSASFLDNAQSITELPFNSLLPENLRQ